MPDRTGGSNYQQHSPTFTRESNFIEKEQTSSPEIVSMFTQDDKVLLRRSPSAKRQTRGCQCLPDLPVHTNLAISGKSCKTISTPNIIVNELSPLMTCFRGAFRKRKDTASAAKSRT